MKQAGGLTSWTELRHDHDGRRQRHRLGSFARAGRPKLMLFGNRNLFQQAVQRFDGLVCVNVLGLAFTQNCEDLSNKNVADLVPPVGLSEEAEHEDGINPTRREKLLRRDDAIVTVVSHGAYLDGLMDDRLRGLMPSGVIIDIKSVYDADQLRARSFTHAASSSAYCDDPGRTKIEDRVLPFGAAPHTQSVYSDFRPGDGRRSQADSLKAVRLLGDQASHRLHDGLIESVARYAVLWAGARS